MSESQPASKRARGDKFAEWFRTLLPGTVRLAAGWRKSWAKCYDELVRLDHRSDREIADVCQWARGNDFWRRNFFSPVKLRDRNAGKMLYFDVFAEGLAADSGAAAAMPRHELEACEACHLAFAAVAKRSEPFRLHAAAWRALLASPEFAGREQAAPVLGEVIGDIEHAVRYVVAGIRDGKRNAGALKLANFLKPATFFAELAEARQQMRGVRKSTAPGMRLQGPGATPALPRRARGIFPVRPLISRAAMMPPRKRNARRSPRAAPPAP